MMIRIVAVELLKTYTKTHTILGQLPELTADVVEMVKLKNDNAQSMSKKKTREDDERRHQIIIMTTGKNDRAVDTHRSPFVTLQEDTGKS